MEILIKKLTDEEGKELTGYDRELPFKISKDNIEDFKHCSNIPWVAPETKYQFAIGIISPTQGD